MKSLHKTVRLVLLAGLAAPSAGTALGDEKPRVVRTDHSVQGDPGVRLFVREVRVKNGTQAQAERRAILLIHGASPAGVPWFDLDVAGGSLAADLAASALTVYVMDIRGYGQSSRPAEMLEPPNLNPPLVRSNEAARDIGAVVDWIRRRQRVQRVALLGWATGGHWAGFYSSLYSDKVSHLVLVNTLYGGSSQHPYFADLEDPRRLGHFNQTAVGAYRFRPAEWLFERWDRSIPVEDKSLWRDPIVAEAYKQAALASDPTSNSRTPPSLRVPTGPIEDAFYIGMGRKFWDASLIRVPTLVVRAENDFWSRPQDVEKLLEHLVHAPTVRTTVIPGATHYFHLDRPERGRSLFLKELLSFLTDA